VQSQFFARFSKQCISENITWFAHWILWSCSYGPYQHTASFAIHSHVIFLYTGWSIWNCILVEVTVFCILLHECGINAILCSSFPRKASTNQSRACTTTASGYWTYFLWLSRYVSVNTVRKTENTGGPSSMLRDLFSVQWYVDCFLFGCDFKWFIVSFWYLFEENILARYYAHCFVECVDTPLCL
jgi:hypothetical protein